MDKEIEYEISSEHFDSFRVKVKKGKVIWTSDRSHPNGADWMSLKAYYQTRQYKVEIKEIKDGEK